MKRIALSGKANSGKFALVDDEDYIVLSKYKWYGRSGYAYRHEHYYLNGKRLTRGIAMHRLLTNAEKHHLVDHIDFNRLNNCKDNLRLATKSQNSQNRVMPQVNTSGYKGVTWDKSRGKWAASIKHQGQRKYLGRFTDVKQAAKAYNDAALQLFDNFAKVNEL